MSVYTKITSDEVSKYLEDYSVGLFESLEGISDGIENTNYILKTSKGEYIFTIFENIDANKVIQYLKLMNFLNESNFKCARVHKRKDNQLCGLIQKKSIYHGKDWILINLAILLVFQIWEFNFEGKT